MQSTEPSRVEDQAHIATWRRPLVSLRGLHLPLGLHLGALIAQTYWWTSEAMRCSARSSCAFPWFSEEHAITLSLSMGLVLYFWLGFGVLSALLDRSFAPFRKAPRLALAMIATTALALLVATTLAFTLGHPSGPAAREIVIY